jgi:hypothetical protein
MNIPLLVIAATTIAGTAAAAVRIHRGGRWQATRSGQAAMLGLIAAAAVASIVMALAAMPEAACAALRKSDPAQLANLAASALVWVAATSAAVVYHLCAPWNRSRIGRHMMAVTVSIGLLGLYTVVVSLFWSTGPVAMVLRILRTSLLVLLAGMMVQRVRLVIDAQRDHAPPPVPPPK